MQRHASRRIGPAANGGARLALSSGREEHLAARLRLLEGFVARTDVADCAQWALQWLSEVLGITPNAASIRLHRARGKFVEELRKIDGGAGHEEAREGRGR